MRIREGRPSVLPDPLKSVLGASPSLPRLRGETLSELDSRTPYGNASGPISICPAAVAKPLDTDDVSTLLSWASSKGQAVVPRGAGTGMPGGNVGPGIALDLGAHFTDVEKVDVSTRTVRVGAGALAADVEAAARGAGLFLPPLPASAERCTVGGMVANNAAGARSFGYGAVRDWVRTLDVVMADGGQHRLARGSEGPAEFGRLRSDLEHDIGTRPRGWPNVRKNSSGYALDRFLPGGDPVELIVGSEGTLAVVTSVTFDLAPIPEHRAVVILGLRDRHDLPMLVESIPEMGASACEFFGLRFLQIAALADHPIVGAAALDAEFVFLVEFDGTAGEVSERVVALYGLASDLGARTVSAETESARKSLWEIRHAASPLIAAAAQEGRVSTQIIEDSVVPPDVLGQYLAGLDRILEANQTDAVIFGHAGDGNVHVNPLLDVRRPSWRKSARTILNETVDLVAGLGGTLSGEHGDGRIRAPFLESIWGPTLTDCFRRTKEAIDPVGILNPGVILPRPGQDPLEGLWPQHGIAT